jgi:hypothetical protein
MAVTEANIMAAFKRSIEDTAGSSELFDFWKGDKSGEAMATGTELGMLRLAHRFRSAKTARAHESIVDDSRGIWLFSMAFNELEMLYRKGV